MLAVIVMSDGFLTAVADRACDAAPSLAPLSQNACEALLDKLDVHSLMQPGGMEKATMAARMLADGVRTPGTVAAVASTSGGVKILIQTSLLHPDPLLRLDAISVISRCCASLSSEKFVEEALKANLPLALVRLCAEQDRRAKAAGSNAVVDPDLPVRRVAVACLHSLMLKVSAAVTLRVLAAPEWRAGLVATCLTLLGNTDDSIRVQGAALVAGLLGLKGRRYWRSHDVDVASTRQSFVQFCSENPEKAAEMLLCGLGQAGEVEVRLTALDALCIFSQEAERFRTHLRSLDGAEALLGPGFSADRGEEETAAARELWQLLNR